jgi:phage terminase small subunit
MAEEVLMPLTAKQAAFVSAYLLDPNGKKAAITAGYSAATAEAAASRLLRHPAVAEALAKRRAVLSVRSGVTPEMVVSELARLGFADIRQVLDWRTIDRNLFDEAGEPAEVHAIDLTIKDAADLSPDSAAAIAEISQSKDGTIKVKMHDKLGALVRIGQHLGMFRAPAGPEEPGKKELVAAKAKSAESGTSWDGLLQ